MLNHQKFVIGNDVLLQNLGGELVLLHLSKEEYFGLDQVGTDMLTALQESGSVEDACELLLQKYDVAPEQLQQDLLELMTKLKDHGLVNLAAA